MKWAAPALLISLFGAPSGAVTAKTPEAAFLGGASGLRHRLAALESEARQIESRSAERGRVYVRMVRLGLLPMSDGFAGLLSHAQRMEMLARLLEKDLARFNSLRQQSLALQALLADVQSEPDSAVRQVGSYRRSQEAILAARERESAFERAFRSNWKPEDSMTVYGSVNSPRLGATFASARGRLGFPVEGRAHVREVPANADYGPGLRFQVDGGVGPRSVFRGRVVLVGDYGELAQAVVIDHGGGYSTLTAGLKTVFIEAGQQLPAGAPLGELRDDIEKRELYFELRRAGTPVPSAEWFGL